MTPAIKARTILRLGLANVARVAAYRLGLRTGLGGVRQIASDTPRGPFFTATAARTGLPAPSEAWRDKAIYFGHLNVPLVAGKPDWFFNPYTGKRLADTQREWWRIPDFDAAAGDIKVIWEPSRFDWVIAAAERAAAGMSEGWDQLEAWLADWCETNPPYRGPNWKCGQEASIRVMHLAMAAVVTDNHQSPTSGLLDLIECHLTRIAPTIQYAIGQDNNHGTSEAAALFIGGSWLERAGRPAAAKWTRTGRRLMENRVARLVASDGSFSQHSLTYHRVLVDTLVMAEAWRIKLDLPDFSPRLRERAGKAASWLYAMIDAETGDGPNLGSNDGARLLPLTDTGYRDFRPSVQTAMALFHGKRAYAVTGVWDAPLAWLDIAMPDARADAPASAQLDQGGYSVLRQGKAFALLRYPRFQFRPAQADALHVDLWVAGENILRDAGTYSYSAETAVLNRFAGTAGHCTVAFDGRDQMPRLGRFLFGEWLSARNVTFDREQCAANAGYIDWKGACHNRGIELSAVGLLVTDRLSGQFRSAVMRWRLRPGNWRIEVDTITDGSISIRIASDVPIKRFELTSAPESLHYLEQHPIPVVELEVHSPARITSEITWP